MNTTIRDKKPVWRGKRQGRLSKEQAGQDQFWQHEITDFVVRYQCDHRQLACNRRSQVVAAQQECRNDLCPACSKTLTRVIPFPTFGLEGAFTGFVKPEHQPVQKSTTRLRLVAGRTYTPVDGYELYARRRRGKREIGDRKAA